MSAADTPPSAAATDPADTRCGFVAVLGAPNAGKSTLVNHFVGFKVSIVTHKVQTTRARVRGVAMAGPAQIVFVDTPGIFRPRRRLDRAMVQAAWHGAGDADILLVLVDAQRERIDDDTARIIDGLREAGRRAVLVLNKVDLVAPASLLAKSAALNATGRFTDTFMISAHTGSGCADLLDHLVARLPSGPWLYPADEVSDLPQRLLAAEITREQVFLRLHQELPYSMTVETEAWSDREDGSVVISQVIYVQRSAHKKMVLGKSGRQIKAIGAAARAELGRLLDRRAHLFLYVKVRENWMDDPERYRLWGLDHGA